MPSAKTFQELALAYNKADGLGGVKALSIRAPWSWLIVQGYKDVENREWGLTNPATRYRGRFMIHQTTTDLESELIGAMRLIHARLPARQASALLAALPPKAFYQPGVIGEAHMEDWRSKEELSMAMGEPEPWDKATQRKREAFLSPWYVGASVVIFRDVKAWPRRIDCKGALGFFEPKA